MSEKQTGEHRPESKPQTGLPDQAGPDEGVADALARVQDAVVEMKDGDLRESLEAAIDSIDAARGTPGADGSDPLAPVADALEGALDELEKGKVANLLPVIEQAQTIVES
jgi:hypothetical protein